jgi:Heparinase II/III-like protein
MSKLFLMMIPFVTACMVGEEFGLSKEHPRIFVAANRERLAADLASGRPAPTRFREAVDRWTAGSDYYGFGAWNAALVGQLTGDQKYCAAAIAAVDAQVTAAVTAVKNGGAPAVAGDSYLQIGEMIGDLALVYDWCGHELDDDRRKVWATYAYQAVWNVWHPSEATWGPKKIPWSGWGTDNPSNNYYYSFLRATMLVAIALHDEQGGADELMSELRDVHFGSELIPTLNSDLDGGGSREGTGYGVSMRRLFELYDLWKASTGEELATRTSHTRASMLAMMHQIVPTLDRVAPTGDHARDATAALFDYHRNYLQTLIRLFPDDAVAHRAQSLLAASSVPQMESQFMYVYDFLYENPSVAPSALSDLGTAYHAPGIGQLYARSGWDTGATWINLTAGPFTESHAHQDQGALTLYKDGWLVYDANVDSASGLHQTLDAHSLVRIVDGGKTVEQRRGTTSKLVALHRGEGWLHAAADLTPAYAGNPAVQQVQREIVFIEPDTVVVYDRVTTRAGGQQVWQLATPVAPAISGARATVTGAHTLSVQRVAPTSAAWAATDLRNVSSDFTGGYRLDATLPGGDQRYVHVLWTGSAVGSVTAQAEGAALQLPGGRTASVRFNRDSIGCYLSIDGQELPLGPGVDKLPE